MLFTCDMFMHFLLLIQSWMSIEHLPLPIPSATGTEPFPTHVESSTAELERVWAPNNPYHARQAASKKAENGLFENALSAQRSNAKFKTYPPHLWGLDTRITATRPPCLTISFPAFFLRALRLNVHLQAKTQGLPCLGKFRLICTTPIQLVHLIMTWRQNETMQQCFIQNLKTICKEQPSSLTCLRESFMKKTKRSVMREIIWPQ